jgi:hypothetical protein
MQSIAKLGELIDERLLSSPKAVTLNAIREGLLDEGSNLSRQTLLKGLMDWKTKTNASDDEAAKKLFLVLNPDLALDATMRDVNGKSLSGLDFSSTPFYVIAFFLALGIVAFIVMLVQLFKKVIS